MSNWLFTLNLWKYVKTAENSLKKWIDEALEILNDFAVEISPEDTGDFVKNHKIISAKIENNKIVWTLENNTPYAIYLEYWVWWKEYNYYKWARWWSRTKIHVWVWNRTYTRTLDENQTRIIQLIQNKIRLW